MGFLNQRAREKAILGKRVHDPSPQEPALIIIVDEYAELPEEARDCADSIARRGRAVAVSLLAATQSQRRQPWARTPPPARKWTSASRCASASAVTLT
ncbi:MAG TPA: hypothetical protein VHZ03_41710 [Trebonia sp.]|nr:hypothetical protein [Trebonia sp.]